MLWLHKLNLPEIILFPLTLILQLFLYACKLSAFWLIPSFPHISDLLPKLPTEIEMRTNPGEPACYVIKNTYTEEWDNKLMPM